MLILMLIRSFIHDLSGSLSNDEDSKIYPSLSSNQGEDWANHYSKIFLDLLLSIQWLYIIGGIKSKYHHLYIILSENTVVGVYINTLDTLE